MSTPSYPSSVSETTSIESKNTNHKKKQPNANKKKPRPTVAPKAVPESFSQKLGHTLADGLVKDPIRLREPLNLVDRLTFANSSVARTTTTTTTTTVVKEEEIIVISQDPRASTKSLVTEAPHARRPKSPRLAFNLDDFAALTALEKLIEHYGRVSHMGILDSSYTFFITEDRKAALYYKVKDKIAVVGGDPLCDPSLFPQVLSEFEKYRKRSGWGIAFLGAGETFVEYVKKQKWTTMCFAVERVLNPMTNPVLHGNAGKSITRISKNLMDPKKEGITLEAYTPRLGKNVKLQQQLVKVYEEWRDHRNGSKRPQAYITIYDPFALPELMTYIYSKDRNGVPHGFAALRILGANKGYHLDPYVAAPGAPKGITDLLLYGMMALLDTAKISYLSLGYEPLDDLGDITGMPKLMAKLSRKIYRRIFQGLQVSGKKDYHDKFRPDEAQQSNLYLAFPPGIPSLRHMTAIVHVANIKLRLVAFPKPTMKPVAKNGKESKDSVVSQDEKVSQSSSNHDSTRANSSE